MLVRIRPPGLSSDSYMTSSYPSGARSLATVREAQPAPISATRLPFFSFGAVGSRWSMSPRRSAATRLSRQIATGFSSTRPRRQTGSQGRSQTRPRIAGNTLDLRLSM